MTEPEAIALAKLGTPAGFEYLYEKYKGYVYSVIRKITGDKLDVAEDLTQDVFLKVHRRLPDFEGKSKFSTWLYRIAANTAIDHIRYDKKDVSIESLSIDEQEKLFAVDGTADATIDRVDLERHISELPENQQRALMMHDESGYTYKEIGAAIGRAPSRGQQITAQARQTLKTNLRRGRQKHDSNVTPINRSHPDGKDI